MIDSFPSRWRSFKTATPPRRPASFFSLRFSPQLSYHPAVAQRNKIVGVALIVLALVLMGTEILLHSLRQRYESHWEKFTSTEGNFSVVMPGKPKAETQSLPINGIKMEEHRFSVWFGNALFAVSYVDGPVLLTPVAGERMLDAVGQGLTQASGRRTLSAYKLIVNDYPVREYKTMDEDGSQTDVRLYLVRRRLYFLIVAQDRVTYNEVDRFFDSFTFDPRE